MMAENTHTLAQYYIEKYGTEVISELERDAAFCAQKNDLGRRNRLLRVRDMIMLGEICTPQNQDTV